MDPYKFFEKHIQSGKKVLQHSTKTNAQGEPLYVVRDPGTQTEMAQAAGFFVLADKPVETVEATKPVEPKKPAPKTQTTKKKAAKK